MRLTTYTENQKIDALKLWLVTGNLAGTAVALKIPYETLKTWRYSKWWADTAVEIKAEGRLELSSKLKKIAEKALGETLDRLENGDYRMSPTGSIDRIPVPAATAAKIATDFLQKSEDLDKVQENESIGTVNDRLKALSENFEKFSRKIRRIEVEDAQINGTSPEEASQEEADVGTEGERLRLRDDAEDGLDTFDAEFIEKTE